MAMPEEYKNLKRRFNELTQEWNFMVQAHGTITNEYGYVPSSPLERIQLHNKIHQATQDFMLRLNEYQKELDKMSNHEEERIELEQSNSKSYELEL